MNTSPPHLNFSAVLLQFLLHEAPPAVLPGLPFGNETKKDKRTQKHKRALLSRSSRRGQKSKKRPTIQRISCWCRCRSLKTIPESHAQGGARFLDKRPRVRRGHSQLQKNVEKKDQTTLLLPLLLLPPKKRHRLLNPSTNSTHVFAYKTTWNQSGSIAPAGEKGCQPTRDQLLSEAKAETARPLF